ncbi:hypothetical protein MMC29_001518 [Sticta canariensis]|nr:hypothetical protein [Sticta canariensis]
MAACPQASFVEQLYKTGMVDEGEKDMLSDVIDRQLRRLGRRGPQWRVPLVVEVLRGMPALQGLPNKAFDQIVGRGRLVRYNPDQVIWTPPQDTQHAKGGGIPCRGTGIFVVVVGLVKWTYAPPGQPLRVRLSHLICCRPVNKSPR